MISALLLIGALIFFFLLKWALIVGVCCAIVAAIANIFAAAFRGNRA